MAEEHVRIAVGAKEERPRQGRVWTKYTTLYELDTYHTNVGSYVLYSLRITVPRAHVPRGRGGESSLSQVIRSIPTTGGGGGGGVKTLSRFWRFGNPPPPSPLLTSTGKVQKPPYRPKLADPTGRLTDTPVRNPTYTCPQKLSSVYRPPGHPIHDCDST